MKSAVPVVALHGFLGLPSDWDFLVRRGLRVRAIDLYREAVPRSGGLLIGYSMGGRVALHTLLAGADYRAAVLISTRVSGAEEGRGEADERWAKRFENEEWSSVVSDWMAQNLFAGSAVERREEDFDRRLLATMMRRWSVASIPAALPRLQQLSIPTLWIAGTKDPKYVNEANSAAERMRNAKVKLIEGSHRLIVDRPDEVADAIEAFAATLE